jgi:flagella basal body P-ring formation protein FlgA
MTTPLLPRHAAWRPRGLASLLLASVALLPSPSAIAQQAEGGIEVRVHEFLHRQVAGLPGEVSIELAPLDPNSQLPACAALEVFLPAGTRAWGRFSVGVRCDSPVTWTAYLQARVAVVADYLVAARPLRAGQVLGPADLGARRGDLTALSDNLLTDPTQAVGHHTRIAVAAGSPLRGDMLRVPHAVRQGQNGHGARRGRGLPGGERGPRDEQRGTRRKASGCAWRTARSSPEPRRPAARSRSNSERPQRKRADDAAVKYFTL